MAYRITNELEEASEGGGKASEETGTGTGTGTGLGSVSTSAGTSGTVTTRRKSKLDEDEEREAVFFRLEGLGYRVGLGLVERYVFF